mgnify:CR=1 FL=1
MAYSRNEHTITIYIRCNKIFFATNDNNTNEPLTLDENLEGDLEDSIDEEILSLAWSIESNMYNYLKKMLEENENGREQYKEKDIDTDWTPIKRNRLPATESYTPDFRNKQYQTHN